MVFFFGIEPDRLGFEICSKSNMGLRNKSFGNLVTGEFLVLFSTEHFGKLISIVSHGHIFNPGPFNPYDDFA